MTMLFVVAVLLMFGSWKTWCLIVKKKLWKMDVVLKQLDVEVFKSIFIGKYLYMYVNSSSYIGMCFTNIYFRAWYKWRKFAFLKWDQMIKIIPQSMVGPAIIFFSKLENWQSQVCYLSFKILTKICAPEHSRNFTPAHKFTYVYMCCVCKYVDLRRYASSFKHIYGCTSINARAHTPRHLWNVLHCTNTRGRAA